MDTDLDGTCAASKIQCELLTFIGINSQVNNDSFTYAIKQTDILQRDSTLKISRVRRSGRVKRRWRKQIACFSYVHVGK